MPHARSAHAAPVFLDGSGRRRRLMKFIGTCLGVVLVATLALLMLAMSGASPINIPGFPAAVGGDAETSSPPAGSLLTTTPAGSTLDNLGTDTSPTPSESVRRHIPSQTPSHPRPTKTK